MLYFAYGANLNKRAMKRRCPASEPLHTAVLENYRLCFRRYADIGPENGAAVHGALWKVTPACMRALDMFEGSEYRHITVNVAAEGKTFEAVAYVMHGAPPLAPPDIAYYREIAVGYQDWGLDEQRLRRARYDTLNVGPALPPQQTPAQSPPQRRRTALWDPAAQSSGALDDLIRRPPRR